MNFDEERLEAHCRDLERHIGPLIAENEQLHARVRALILSGARGLVAEAFAAGAAEEREAAALRAFGVLVGLPTMQFSVCRAIRARGEPASPEVPKTCRAGRGAPMPIAHSTACAATKVIGRMGSRSGLLWCPGDEKSCSCDAGAFVADLRALHDAKEKALAALRDLRTGLDAAGHLHAYVKGEDSAADLLDEAIAALEGEKTKAADPDEGEDP